MRPALFYNPRLLCERLAELSLTRRRLARLRNTVASRLEVGHIDSLELLELLSSLNPGIIYDIGANVGTWTLLAKAIFPDATVHAFEPLRAHHAAFDREAGQLSGVQLHKIALGESVGSAILRVTDFSDASSVLPLSPAGEQHWNIREVTQEQVPVARLDDWCQEGNWPPPDLIKLDVQGFELNVLNGALNCLDSALAILVEVSFREYYAGQCLFPDVLRFLAERDFSLHALGMGTALGRALVQSDALFVANRVRDELN